MPRREGVQRRLATMGLALLTCLDVQSRNARDLFRGFAELLLETTRTGYFLWRLAATRTPRSWSIAPAGGDQEARLMRHRKRLAFPAGETTLPNAGTESSPSRPRASRMKPGSRDPPLSPVPKFPSPFSPPSIL